MKTSGLTSREETHLEEPEIKSGQENSRKKERLGK
jgi:hypothetical protein